MDIFPYKNIVDFEKLCRICLNNNEQRFKIEKEKIKIQNKSSPVLYLLNLLCEIKLERKYPDEICLSCLTQLENLYKFKLQIEKSEEVLKKHLGYRDQPSVTQNGVLDLPQRPSIWCQSTTFKQNNPKLAENLTKLSSYQPPNSVVDLSKGNEVLTANFADLKLHREDYQDKLNVVGGVSVNSHLPFHSGLVTGKGITVKLEHSVTTDSQIGKLNLLKKQLDEVHNLKNATDETNDKIPSGISSSEEFTDKLSTEHPSIHSEVSLQETDLHSNDSTITNQTESIPDVQNQVFCSSCNKTFKSKYTLNVHLKRHRLEGQFACTLCGKRFSSRGCLNRHLKIHTGEKNFECHVCQKRFLSSHNLIVHERIHTGEKPYLCSHCGKAFSNRTGLNFHVRIHTNTKPYQCTVCDKAFGAQSHLLWHTMIHTGEKPFICKICDKAFIKKCDLQRHSTVHTGLKPFQCSFCEKRFSTKLNLQYHEMIHKDDRPHICTHCDKRFIRRYYLQEHITKHHSVIENTEASNI